MSVDFCTIDAGFLMQIFSLSEKPVNAREGGSA
jgi:hypothetical protein